MIAIVYIVAGIVVGALIGILYSRSAVTALSTKAAMTEADNERLQKELALRNGQYDSAREELSGLRTASEVMSDRIRSMEQDKVRMESDRLREVEEIKRRHEQAVAEERARSKEMIDSLNQRMLKEQAHSAELRAESDRQWAQKIDLLREELQKSALKELASKQESLQESNLRQMDELMKPIKEQFAEFKRSVEESKTQNEVSKKQLEKSFEDTMKLFQQTQEQAVASIREQTRRIGDDASNLTKALKGDSKVQGDFGEMLLEKMLENSGLRKNEEYFIQESTKDEDGRNLRPDVVVRFPEGRSVVIDSKVSLTAYAEAVQAESDGERERLMKEHVRSVRRHIDELAEKAYDNVVSDAVGYVLMYMPIESSYISAMKCQPDLSQYAYKKRIIVISPSNLMMALQLAYNLWQYDRQGKNVEQIVKSATDMYEKMAGFSDTFLDIEAQIARLSKSFTIAKDRLYEGRGNIMRRMENLKSLGVTPKKQIKGLDEEE